MVKKPTTTVATICTLASLEGLAAKETADQIGERYSARSNLFVEMGKLIYHLETRVGLPKGQTIYGMLKSRGVPEGSVNNARLVARFIETFVVTDLVPETRADQIITYRVVNQCDRIVTGKTACKLAAVEIAAILKDGGNKATIGDELDCLAEHGLTIAGKAEKDRADAAERQRLAEEAAKAKAAEEAAKAQAQAQATPAPAPAPAPAPGAPGSSPAPSAETPATPAPAPASAPEASATPPADQSDPADQSEDAAPTVVDGTKAPAAGNVVTGTFGGAPAPEAAAPAAPSTSTPAPAPTAADPSKVIAAIEAAELASYDLDPAGLQAVLAKLDAWRATIESTLGKSKAA